MLLEAIFRELATWSTAEIVAAALGLAYLILAARESLWCWPCAFISTIIYSKLFLDKQLYQQSALQIFYLGMAVYGYISWRWGGKNRWTASSEPSTADKSNSATALLISTWPLNRHIQAAAVIAILTLATGWAEARFTTAPMPYLDAFTTWGSIVTTWMVTRKILENWLYWLVVDGLSLYLYYVSDLPATTLLFVIYLGIVIAGYMNWRKQMALQTT